MAMSVIIGGSSGIGRHIAERMARRGEEVVISGRDATRASAVAAEIGAARGLGLDLSVPKTIADGLADIGPVAHLVITAIEQGVNSLAAFDIDAAVRSITVKLVGYTETIRVLHPRFEPGASIVVFGGLAKDRPYPGSTVVTAFNGGVSTLVATLAVELAPTRVNALHPGVVGDSPKWRRSRPPACFTHADRSARDHGRDRGRHRLPPAEQRDQRPEPVHRWWAPRDLTHGGGQPDQNFRRSCCQRVRLTPSLALPPPLLIRKLCPRRPFPAPSCLGRPRPSRLSSWWP